MVVDDGGCRRYAGGQAEMLSMMRGGAALLAAELRRLSMQRGGAAPPAAELRWLSMQRVAHVVHGTVTLVFSSTHLGALASLWQGTYEFACVQMLVRRLAGEQASGSVWLGIDVQLSIPAARWAELMKCRGSRSEAK